MKVVSYRHLFGDNQWESENLDKYAGAEFFMALYNSDIPYIAIENPVGIMSTRFRKPDQIV